MQVFMSRREIRRRVRAALGETQDEGLATMNRQALDDAINDGCLQAHLDMRPQRARREATFAIGVQQQLIAYPDDCGPGCLENASVFDATGKLYWRLRRRAAQSQQSADQALAAGGDDAADAAGTPKWIADGATGWQLYPMSDIAYQVRIQYVERQVFANDDELSLVDGMLITSYALFLRTRDFDAERSKQYLGDYRARMMGLKGFEQAGDALSMDPDADFDQDCDDQDGMPQWDTRPSRQG